MKCEKIRLDTILFKYLLIRISQLYTYRLKNEKKIKRKEEKKSGRFNSGDAFPLGLTLTF